MTHKDIYEKFMIEYDKANITSSYPSLTKYEIATLLDKAYLALIAQKFTGNNRRSVDFEGDLKSIEDLRPLVTTTSKKINSEIAKHSSNDMTYSTPVDMLYYVKSDINIPYGLKPTQIITHQAVDNYKVTAINYPWIDVPVCMIQGDDIHVFVDPVEVSDQNSLNITYIKKPHPFIGSLVNVEKDDPIIVDPPTNNPGTNTPGTDEDHPGSGGSNINQYLVGVSMSSYYWDAGCRVEIVGYTSISTFVNKGTKLQLKATPSSQYVFDCWKNLITNEIKYTEVINITVNDTNTWQAYFIQKNTSGGETDIQKYTIGLMLSNEDKAAGNQLFINGDAYSSPIEVPEGKWVSITAVPAKEYEFVYFYNVDDVSDTIPYPAYSFHSSQSITYGAKFQKKNNGSENTPGGDGGNENTPGGDSTSGQYRMTGKLYDYESQSYVTITLDKNNTVANVPFNPCKGEILFDITSDLAKLTDIECSTALKIIDGKKCILLESGDYTGAETTTIESKEGGFYYKVYADYGMTEDPCMVTTKSLDTRVIRIPSSGCSNWKLHCCRPPYEHKTTDFKLFDNVHDVLNSHLSCRDENLGFVDNTLNFNQYQTLKQFTYLDVIPGEFTDDAYVQFSMKANTTSDHIVSRIQFDNLDITFVQEPQNSNRVYYRTLPQYCDSVEEFKESRIPMFETLYYYGENMKDLITGITGDGDYVFQGESKIVNYNQRVHTGQRFSQLVAIPKSMMNNHTFKGPDSNFSGGVFVLNDSIRFGNVEYVVYITYHEFTII